MLDISATFDFPDPKHPLKTFDEELLALSRESLRTAFENSRLTQKEWVRELGRSDKKCFGRWMENPGLLDKEQVKRLCRLGSVTVDFLRFGFGERLLPGSVAHDRLFMNYLNGGITRTGALTIDGMTNLYAQLNMHDRSILSDIAMRLKTADADVQMIKSQAQKIEILHARLAELTGDYEYFAGKDADDEAVERWRTAIHERLARTDDDQEADKGT